MNDEIIILESVSKCYPFKGRDYKDRGTILNFFRRKKFHAIKNITFSIKEGESVGFLGKNGAGKTILLKLIAGIVFPTDGKVTVNKPVSPIFEYGAGFHFEFTGMENIFLYGALLGIKKREIQDKLDKIVKFSELENFLGFKLKHYSTGMKIRLAFSVATILKPEILILDEALSSGDQGFIKKVHNVIFNLKEHGITLLISSHSYELLKKFCKKGIVLDKGNMVFYGGINEAIDYYQEKILLDKSSLVNAIKSL